MATFGRAKPAATPVVVGSTTRDAAAPSDATDTISALRWSPVGNLLTSASWDGKVRMYDVATDGSVRRIAMLSADGPVFSCDFSKDGTLITAAGADKRVHVLQGSSQQTVSFAAHDAPIRSIRFARVSSAPAPIIATGSWDRKLRYWDLRNTASPLASLECGERVYAMDTAGRILAVSTADQKVHIIDLETNPTQFLRTMVSPLKHQTRVVTAFPDGSGFCMGGIEGRVCCEAMKESDAKKFSFSFRCHRDQSDDKKLTRIWAVNDISIHPVHNRTISTAGADGTFSFWDIASKMRLKGFASVGGAITATGFNRDGNVFAYAVGYDWSMGYSGNSPDYPNKLMLHPVAEEEVKPRKPA